jgi:tRNA (cmo5U34)-methyltransferase
MSTIWDASTYDSERRRLVPCFDEFYGTAAELAARTCPASPRILDLGAGTGLLSSVIVQRVEGARLCLLDGSAEMLQRAAIRLASWKPEILVQPLTDALPSGPFDAVVSALAIHHLSDDDKRGLYARILKVLSPGGIFINAEQVSGRSSRVQQLFEAVHLDCSRALGSSETEIQGAIERMSYDRCATLADQIDWLDEVGFKDTECFYRLFRFAVFGGWRPKT